MGALPPVPGPRLPERKQRHVPQLAKSSEDEVDPDRISIHRDGAARPAHDRRTDRSEPADPVRHPTRSSPGTPQQPPALTPRPPLPTTEEATEEHLRSQAPGRALPSQPRQLPTQSHTEPGTPIPTCENTLNHRRSPLSWEEVPAQRAFTFPRRCHRTMRRRGRAAGFEEITAGTGIHKRLLEEELEQAWHPAGRPLRRGQSVGQADWRSGGMAGTSGAFSMSWTVILNWSG